MTLRSVSSSVPPGRQAPYIVAQSGVPVCLAPNGTVATNGIITLGTALLFTYSGGIWLRLPANAIVGGAAGLYWAVMTSTTQGQVYTNFFDPATEFVPTIPTGALVNAVGSNAAYTQTTASDITLVNVTIPGGSMGSLGAIRVIDALWSNNNSAGNKTPKLKFATETILSGNNGSPVTTTTVYRHTGFFRNRGTEAINVYNPFTNFGITNSSSQSTVNTANNQALTFTAQIAVATDWMVLENFTSEILRA